MKILVTGASGFVGGGVIKRLNEQSNFHPVAAIRREITGLPESVAQVRVQGLAVDTDWSLALKGIDHVVHAAARVHVMDDMAADPLSEFRQVNVLGTLSLARQAAAVGIKRFVFISSIKVNGEVTSANKPFTPKDQPAPVDPYGVSKMEAEQGLYELADETGMEIVIIRPVLVYGPGVKANFLRMMSWLDKGIPLPLASIDNKRSLVALDNLVDLIITCIEHPAAANQTFLVSDGADLSTSGLLSRIGSGLGKPARLIPFPVWLLHATANLLGKSDISQRLCSSLQVDISTTRSLLGWSPPISVDEALHKTAQHFLKQQENDDLSP